MDMVVHYLHLHISVVNKAPCCGDVSTAHLACTGGFPRAKPLHHHHVCLQLAFASCSIYFFPILQLQRMLFVLHTNWIVLSPLALQSLTWANATV